MLSDGGVILRFPFCLACFNALLEIILDRPFGFPINNIISRNALLNTLALAKVMPSMSLSQLNPMRVSVDGGDGTRGKRDKFVY